MGTAKNTTRAAARPVAIGTDTFIDSTGRAVPVAAIAGATVHTRVDAPAVLARARETILGHEKSRDIGQAAGATPKRSMASVVEAFAALEDITLTERQGWAFMALVKMSRAHAGEVNGRPDVDNFMDGAAFFGLAAESVGYPVPAAQ